MPKPTPSCQRKIGTATEEPKIVKHIQEYFWRDTAYNIPIDNTEVYMGIVMREKSIFTYPLPGGDFYC